MERDADEVHAAVTVSNWAIWRFPPGRPLNSSVLCLLNTQLQPREVANVGGTEYLLFTRHAYTDSGSRQNPPV
jgi:hypothetical protein